MKTYRIAYISSHPIPYISPFLQKLAAHPQIELTVLYCSDESLGKMHDVDFGRAIQWDVSLLDGYFYKFLKNHSPIGTIYKPPLGLINFGVIKEVISSDYDCIIVYGWHYFTYWLAYITAFLPEIQRSSKRRTRQCAGPKITSVVPSIRMAIGGVSWSPTRPWKPSI